MGRGLWVRVFVGLLLAVLPPILILVGALLLTESLLRPMDPSIVAILVVAGTVAWAAILAVVFARTIDDDIRSFLSLARRGSEAGEGDVGAAYDKMAAALDERDRQVATLAREASAVPIDDLPQEVILALVSAVRSVTTDPTWRCAVLASTSPELLPPGIYLGSEDQAPTGEVGELERWAAASVVAEPTRAEGPWGAFAIIPVSVSDRLRAIVYAPWEGRAEPTPSELAVLMLVGQHFGTALEHSLLYARVRSQADELNRLSAIQADFLRGVTHDLQTPLTSIGALATELKANAAVPESARADLDTITHQAERLRRMVSQLLVASRLEAGVVTPQIEVFAVRPLVDRIWAALRSNRPFTVTVEGAPHLVVADPDRLEQVLWALLDNAVKYSPDGSPIEVRLAASDGQMALTVADRGSGMDEEALERSFDQFYRSAQARRLAPDGSGVGLYAARGLVQAMEGTISIESALGQGTAVTVRLPAEPTDEAD